MHHFTRSMLNSPASNAFNENVMSVVPLSAGISASLLGTADLFLGEDNALNSGEFLTNGLVSAVIPSAGALTGSMIGLGGYGARRALAGVRGRKNPPPNTAVVDLAQRKSRGKDMYSSYGPAGDPYGKMEPPSKDEIKEFLTGSTHAAINGAAIGSVAALIPTARYMGEDIRGESGDNRSIRSLKDSLSESDLRTLNALLEANSGQTF